MLSLRNTTGSALIVSIVLMGTLILMMIFLMERLVPSSRNVRGIENSTIAAYSAQSGIEKSLSTLSIRNPWHSLSGAAFQNLSSSGAGSIGRWGYAVQETGNIIPLPGTGTSEFDTNWNSIGPGRPVQLYIPQSFVLGTTNLSTVQIDLRVPKLWTTDAKAGDSSSTTFHTGSSNVTVVNVIFSNGTTILSPDYQTNCWGWAQEKWLTADRINTSPVNGLGNVCMKEIGGGVNQQLSDYLTANPTFCNAAWCTLKFSVISSLKNAESGNPSLPYLEYRMRKQNSSLSLNDCLKTYSSTSSPSSCGIELDASLPLQFTQINSEWTVLGFRRSIRRVIEQLTTAEGLDFTVFQ